MSGMSTRVVGAALLFALIFLSGFWLSQSGKPLNSLLLTVHKLIAVAAVIFLAVTLHRASQAAPLSARGFIGLALAGLFFFTAIATGGLLSIGKPMPAAVLMVHRVTPFLTVLSTGWLLWRILPAAYT